MSLRLVEVIVADRQTEAARALLGPYCARVWQESVPDGREKFSCVVRPRHLEALLADLHRTFAETPGFSAVVQRIDALLPALQTSVEAPPLEPAERRAPTKLERFLSRDRMSTDEIYDDVVDAVAISPTYLLTVFLSAMIAALGMRSGQTAVVIGAMVIAPLLSPTLALALSATVGDWRLGLRALRTLGAGGALVLASTVLLGFVVEIDPDVPELYNRTIVHLADIALALASGAAGVLAFNRGASASLVGVMIAVALVPPLSAAGLYLGAGDFELSVRALFLFANNLVCINIAGIVTFLLQGLPPKRWRITAAILAVWLVVLALFAAMIVGRIALGISWSG